MVDGRDKAWGKWTVDEACIHRAWVLSVHHVLRQ
jgi:hypothetical protein